MKKVIYLLILPVVMISCLAFARFKNDVNKNGPATRALARFKNEVMDVKNNVVKTLHLTHAESGRYSAIPNVDLMLGSTSEITLIIDGKAYDKEMIYQISGNCIKTSAIVPMAPSKKVNGKAMSNGPMQLYDGKFAAAKIVVKTTNGQIVYMTALDRENLVKEREATSFTEFYSRVHLTDNKGKPYDKAIVSNLKGSVTTTLNPNERVGFMIDGVYYNENDIRFINSRKLNEIMVTGKLSERSVPMAPGEYIKGVGALFIIETTKLKVTADTTQKKRQVGVATQQYLLNESTALSKLTKLSPVPAFKLSSEPQLVRYSVAMVPVSFTSNKTMVADTNQKADLRIDDGSQTDLRIDVQDQQFFTRTHIINSDGKKKDKIHFKLSNGTAGSAELGVDDQAAAFIDGVFYNEDALKKISPEKAATLRFAKPNEVKPGKQPDGNYAMPFSFKTK